MPRNNVSLQKLHIRLVKPSVHRMDQALENASTLQKFQLRRGFPFEGRLYLAPPAQGAPRWLEFVETGIEGPIGRLTNRTNAAVLMIRVVERVFAITFGFGRHQLRESLLVPDFGLRTALNSLAHSSLRSLDTMTVEDLILHTRAQASRASGIMAFGLDVGKDILRGVTGLPRADVPLHSLSGSESTLAVTARTDFAGLGELCTLLLRQYARRSYRQHFAWVDNVARVTDPAILDDLDSELLEHLNSPNPSHAYLAPPEPIEWENVQGFNYTHHRRSLEVDMSLRSYLQDAANPDLDIDTIRSDKVFVYGLDEMHPTDQWPIYKCLVFETTKDNHAYVLTAGTWFEIAREFAQRIRRRLRTIPAADLALPPAEKTTDDRVEPEGDYNVRVSRSIPTLALMDKKLAACASAGAPIEFCDLFSTSRYIVHIKHRKGGSSSLSHLFAQGRASCEALLSDEQFRSEVREHLADVGRRWERLVPHNKPDPSHYNVVFAIIGASGANSAIGIPFFSQLNLLRTFESLTSLGYRVTLLGVPIAAPAG